MCLYESNCVPKPFDSLGQQLYRCDYPPVSQRDAVEAGKILRRLGWEKDKHQRRVNGKKQRRLWRRVDASSASTLDQLPEAGQTPTAAGEVSDPPHVSSLFSEKEQGQKGFVQNIAAVLGNSPEAPEALSVGSGHDVHGTSDWNMWD